MTAGVFGIDTEMLCQRPGSVVKQMRERTRALHIQAERSGIVAALLRGKADRRDYALYLRNLLPAYEAMERILQSGGKSILARVAYPGLYRAPAIEHDLRHLAGGDWQTTLPLLASGRRYAARVAVAAEGDGSRLIAHCYTRYLGDLNGGQVIGRRLARLFDLGDWSPAFNAFPEISDTARFAETFRTALDDAGREAEAPWAAVDEAALAFQMNIQVSIEVSSTFS